MALLRVFGKLHNKNNLLALNVAIEAARAGEAGKYCHNQGEIAGSYGTGGEYIMKFRRYHRRD